MPISELRHIAALAAATSNHLRIEFAALGEDGASFHPAQGEWCAKEVVGHLIEADRHGFTGRVATILGADRPATGGLGPGRRGRGSQRLRAHGRGDTRRVLRGRDERASPNWRR